MPKVREFKVPYGLDQGRRLVTAADAVSGVDYECPNCHTTLRRRRASVRARAHYWHRNKNAKCDQHDYTHTTAILLILQTVLDWLGADGVAPKVSRHCQDCGQIERRELRTGQIVDVKPEEWLPDVVRRPDVLLFGPGGVAVGIVEVLHTHKVDAVKAGDYAAGSYRWIEVTAESIVDAPHEWVAVQHGPVPVCRPCEQAREHLAEEDKRRRERQVVEDQRRREQREKEAREREAQEALEAERRRIADEAWLNRRPAEEAAWYERVRAGEARRKKQEEDRRAQEAADEQAKKEQEARDEVARLEREKVLAAKLREIRARGRPEVYRMMEQEYPAYGVADVLACPACKAVTAIVAWRKHTPPPEPVPPWVRLSGSDWACECQACGRI